MSTFQETLKRLISRNIVITKTKSGKLKTIDFNKAQSQGSPTQYQNRPKWKLSRGYSTTTGYGSGFTNEEIEALRKQMYQDYDIMDTDAIVSSVLDIYADECLGQDTVIPLLDGRKLTIKQLFDAGETDFWLYGLDDHGDFKPSKAEKVIYKGLQKCAKITLDDQTVIKCTLEHLWVVDGVNTQMTKDLNIGDSIYALKTKLSTESGLNKYEMISNNQNQFDYVHRLVARKHNIENYELKNAYNQPVIHHKSLNKYNNNPEELCWMEATEHIKLHSSLNDLMWQKRYSDFEFMEKFRKSIGEKNKIHWQNKSPEFMLAWSKQRSEVMTNHMANLTDEERKIKYGLPGEKNGRWQKGYLTQGSLNGRWIKNKTRAEDINLIEAMFIVAQEYRFITDNLNKILSKYYDFATDKEYLKLIAEICNLCRIDSIKQFPFYYFKLNNPNFIKELRDEGFETSNDLINYCKNKDIRIRTVQRILKEHHYKSIPDFIKSKNHRIINIEYCEERVYDIVNVSNNHLFAIETVDGSKLYTHNCSTYSEQGELLVIKTNDEKIKKILHNLFYDIMNLDFNLWPWIRTACKYGDNFLYLQVAEGVGVVNVMPVHPILMIREEGVNGDPQAVRFRYEGEYGQGWAPNHYFEETEIAHFRLLTDVNFLPYGRSILEGGRQEFKRMRLMEDAMLLNRIMRAPERRLFKIDIGNIAPEEVDGYIEEISNAMKKTPYVDPLTGDLNLRYNILNAMEDFFLPVRGADSGTSIETLPGLQNDKMLEDVEYFKNKMIAAFKVPKDYIGYGGEDNGGTGGKANLASMDIRYARTIERVQKIFVSEFYKIALIHLISQGFDGEDLLNFELTLTNPSLVFERQKTDVLTARVDLAKSAREENPLLSDTYIYKNLWGLSDEEMEELKLQKIEDAKFQFRLKQIVEEGNDPEVTGKSFGTPHDIATMQVASKFAPGQYGETNKSLYTKDERENNPGKPDEHKSSFETRRDQDFGDDPSGRKDMNKMEALIKKFEKYKPKSKSDPKMLSEENLLEIEDNYN